MTKTYHAIGLMSGSSLDGLDIAFCRFDLDGEKFSWELLAHDCVPFDPRWTMRLKKLYSQDALTFAKTHTFFGHYMGELVSDFVRKHGLDPDFVASHGHTVFHEPEPETRMTFQIGDGAALAVACGLPTITNFRQHDVRLGGEGAPLAPIADKYLFPGYDFYLNIGGIANLSANIDGRMIAFDVCAANTLLNFVAAQIGLDYDRDGRLASNGEVREFLLNDLNNDYHYRNPYPKSLSNKWVQSRMVPILIRTRLSPEDKARTVCEHISLQIGNAVSAILEREGLEKRPFRMLATGGGALNRFLMDNIQEVFDHERIEMDVVLPPASIVKFKEAILMAFMGVLRLENRQNVLRSATGASQDSISGAFYQGTIKTI
jgi:anhydro-N-acetylmuramic acid kinase